MTPRVFLLLAALLSHQSFDITSMLLGLRHRIPQLEEEVSVLEREDDGDLYGAVSLAVIQNDLEELLGLVNRLNSTTLGQLQRNTDTAKQLQAQWEEMRQLEKGFDTMQVVKRQDANSRLRRDLEQCRNGHHPTEPPPPTQHGTCPQGQLSKVTGPRVFTAGEYPGSYAYGAWGRDPAPAPGRESWYWMVILTTSNVYAHYVRRYSSLSSLIVGLSVPGNTIIHPSNPTTNTIQGPNAVLHGEALYYNCYNRDAVCRLNLTTKAVVAAPLPKGAGFNSKFNFCHLEACYPYTDLDLATDESGVWVVYTTAQDFGNLVLSEVLPGPEPALGRTWRTSAHKRAVTNTFVACGVLYATRFVDRQTEEIFYAFDTATGRERYDVAVSFKKVSPNIQSLNYSPVDQMLYVYSDSNMVSYNVEFGQHSSGANPYD
ncbi:olfactomedin-4 [Aplochiton taeniatus]